MKSRFGITASQLASLAAVYCLLLLSGLLLLVTPRAGRAQPPGYGNTPGWDITSSYSGTSTLKITDASGATVTDTTTPWTSSGITYMQGGMGSGQTLTATINGTITKTFTWNAHGTGLSAPPAVKVEMIGGASWLCTSIDLSITKSGSCSDTIPGNELHSDFFYNGAKSEASDPPSVARFVSKSGSSFSVTNTVYATVTITVPASNSSGCGFGVTGTFAPIIHPEPYDFVRTNNDVERSNGTLYFRYAWKSTTGDLRDLSRCFYHERVTYPGGNPYFPPPCFNVPAGIENPEVLPGEGEQDDNKMTKGFITDVHGVVPSSSPYFKTTFSAEQRYEYDDKLAETKNVLIPSQTGDNVATITRTIDNQHSSDSSIWWYSCTKKGFTAWLQLQ